MAITKSFGSATISKPGSYSKRNVDNSGGGLSENNDTLFLIGEAELGEPGSSEGIQTFRSSQLRDLVEKYGSGPIVDAALAAGKAPSLTPGIGRAGIIKVYKTNQSTQASLTLQNGNTEDLIILKDRKWGLSGNNISVTVATGSSSNQKNFTIKKLNQDSETLGENPANAIINIQYTGDASTATLDIAGASKTAKTLSTTLAGDQTDGSANLSISLSAYTMKELADFIDAQTGYSASLSYTPAAPRRATELDPRSAVSITSAIDLYRVQEEMIELINTTSVYVEAELAATPVVGVPVNVTDQFLTGGAKGASSNSNFSSGFSASLAEDYNVALPCISQDATDDIALGITDASSSYTISTVLTALNSHLILRGSIKNRKEAQGMGGYRDSSKATAFSTIANFGAYLLQIAMQDVQMIDASNKSVWKQPHIFAAFAAGIRLGTPVGEPLTHKFLNVISVGHAVNPDTGKAAGDFNPATDYEDAIANGVLFSESFNNGHRIVVDNTTYGQDDSFIFNRGSVIEAAQYTEKTSRNVTELAFVGKKVSNGAASSIKTTLRQHLLSLNADDVNIITSSDDAPNGFVEDTFVVTVQGNTARVQVEYKPVQGLDFIFLDFTVGDITQSA